MDVTLEFFQLNDIDTITIHNAHRVQTKFKLVKNHKII